VGGDVRAGLEADQAALAITWGIHTHNDAELAVANSMAAVAAGIRHVQATINGYGERAGNANMVSILANLALKTPHELVPAGGGTLTGLTELSRSVAEIANQKPDDYQPYVGRSAFAHKGGVHGAAVAKVELDGEVLHTAADGNGPVNALDAALRKALRAFYPQLDDVHLIDYKVRILDGDAATAARTRVIIDSSDGTREWSTMGSDTNIIAASAQALADSLEYAIWKSGAELRRRDERHFTTASVIPAATSPTRR